MPTEFSTKQSFEQYLVSFNFTNILGTTQEISSAVVTAIDEASGVDVSTTILDATKQSNTTVLVYVWVQAGTSGHRYIITCKITSDSGAKYELEGVLPVSDIPGVTIVSDAEILNFIDVDEDSVVLIIRDAVEEAVTNYCRRDFISTSYKKKYDGTGTPNLLLDDYPVTALTRLSTSYINVINIRNTSTAYHASCGVVSTGVLLTQESTTNSTVLFTTYDTLTKVVDAINLISGWEAQLASASYANYPSIILREKFGIYCGQSTWVSLSIPDQGVYDYEVDTKAGIITLPYNFLTGTKNIYVEYTAGYTSDTMPEDLKMAIKIWTQSLYRKQQEDSFGLTNYSLGGISQSLISEMPKEVEVLLSNYKRYII